MEGDQFVLGHPVSLKGINFGTACAPTLSSSEHFSETFAGDSSTQNEFVILGIHVGGEEPAGLGVSTRDRKNGGLEHVELESGCDETRDMRVGGDDDFSALVPTLQPRQMNAWEINKVDND